MSDIKKFDKIRRVYFPEWVAKELNLIAGESYVTFVKKQNGVFIKKATLTLEGDDE